MTVRTVFSEDKNMIIISLQVVAGEFYHLLKIIMEPEVLNIKTHLISIFPIYVVLTNNHLKLAGLSGSEMIQ